MSLNSGNYGYSCPDIAFISESDSVLQGHCTNKNGVKEYTSLDSSKLLDTYFVL